MPKKGEIVTGKPSAVLPNEDEKTGAEKRGKLYSKILKSRSSKRSEKTGVMVGSIKEFVEIMQELEEVQQVKEQEEEQHLPEVVVLI